MIPLLFILVLAFFSLNMPVAFSIIAACLAYFIAAPYLPIATAAHTLAGAMDSFLMLALPMFLLTAQLANNGGTTKRIFDFARSLVGWIPGGIGHVNIVTSVIFSGMSGTATADVGGPGLMVTEAMKQQGFGPPFSCAVTIASATVGPIIPPSVPIIIYAFIAGVSVGSLFLAGILPGLLMAGSMMLLVYWISIRRNYPQDKSIDVKNILIKFKDSFWALLTPVILLGSIYTGVCTPTEAAVISATYILIIELFVYKDLTLSEVPRIFAETAVQIGSIMIIFGAAFMLSWIMGREGIPEMITSAVLSVSDDKNVLLLGIIGLMLVFGCFMEGVSLMIILLPVLLPIMQKIQVDLVHFGVFLTLGLTLGVMTPPFGMCLFVISSATGENIGPITKELLPFLLILVVVLFLVTYIPGISLFLPHLLGL